MITHSYKPPQGASFAVLLSRQGFHRAGALWSRLKDTFGPIVDLNRERTEANTRRSRDAFPVTNPDRRRNVIK